MFSTILLQMISYSKFFKETIFIGHILLSCKMLVHLVFSLGKMYVPTVKFMEQKSFNEVMMYLKRNVVPV